MSSNFELSEVARILRCPDDSGVVETRSDYLECSSCARRFPIHCSNFIEILPKRRIELPSQINSAYRSGYSEAFNQKFVSDPEAVAWGADEEVAPAWLQKRLRQVAAVQTVLQRSGSSGTVLCDIAAGAGHYTLAFARLFRIVLHCDLSVDNLNYAWRKALKLGIKNVVFIRADYFSPPFLQSLDRILCFDTLIRGVAHDSTLLSNIGRSLSKSGRAIVDFHNWWHNPLRRVGLLPENFHHNHSYSRSEANKLMQDSGFKTFSYLPFVQEADPSAVGGRLLSRLIPPTRLIYEAGVQTSRSPQLDEVQVAARR